MNKPLEKEHAVTIQTLRSKGMQWQEIAEVMNQQFGFQFSEDSLRKRWSRFNKKSPMATSNNNTNGISLIPQQNTIGSILEYIGNKIDKMSFKSAIKVPHKPKSKQALEVHLLRSDAHVGEMVDPQSTSGLGNYNYNTYLSRLETLTQKVVLFHDQDTKNLGLSKLVIAYLGDQLEGEGAIYKGQSYYIDLPLVDQLFNSVEAEISRFLLPLAEVFHEIEVYCVPGNHGRAGRIGEHHERTNWDYIFYRFLKEIIDRIAPNIKIYISESPLMLVQHGQFTFSYSHGDNVKSYMGIPFYGLDRMVKKITSMFNKYIHYFCVGHFHDPASLSDNIFINGTMVGGSNLSINRMNTLSVPSQKMFYFDSEKGVNRETNLYLEDLTELTPDKNNIFTPYLKK